MDIKIAENIGFCPGVSRAVRMAEDTIRERIGDVYSAGPIIHNPQEVERLREMGMTELSEREDNESSDLKGAKVVIRSHGIAPADKRMLLERDAELVDATCPVVRQAQEAARQMVGEGYSLVVVGSATHPEVLGILGSVDGDAAVVADVEEARQYIMSERPKRVGVISQTTARLGILKEVVGEIQGMVQELKVRNTICESHLKRQEEAERIAGEVDAVFVVGGKNSSNTARLADLCSERGTPTYHIEDRNEIRSDWLSGVKSLAVLGGASTPSYVIERVINGIKEVSRIDHD